MQTGMAAAAAGDCGWVTTENGVGAQRGGCSDRYRLNGKGSEGRGVGLQIWANSSQRSGGERE